ncbi:MAG: hypothetical protein AAFN94_10095 [Pseudomonadota bacterium]
MSDHTNLSRSSGGGSTRGFVTALAVIIAVLGLLMLIGSFSSDGTTDGAPTQNAITPPTAPVPTE